MSTFNPALEWYNHYEGEAFTSFGNHTNECSGSNESFTDCEKMFFSEYIEN